MNTALLNNLSDLVLVEELISQFVVKHPVAEKKSSSISIICDEIISNIFNHNETSVTIEVKLELVNNEISLTFIDNGKIFDPTNYEISSTSDKGIERPVGGLGISIVNKLSDSFHYETIDEKNLLNIKITI